MNWFTKLMLAIAVLSFGAKVWIGATSDISNDALYTAFSVSMWGAAIIAILAERWGGER